MTVRIAPAQGSIVKVTSEVVRFVDNDGATGTVGLKPLRPEAPKCVGYHDLKVAPCWVRLGDTRFEFETRRQAYEELIDPLLRVDRLTRKEPRFTLPEFHVPADSWWNVPIWIVALSMLALLAWLAVVTDQWWAMWLAAVTALQAVYAGLVYLKKKWDDRGSTH